MKQKLQYPNKLCQMAKLSENRLEKKIYICIQY